MTLKVLIADDDCDTVDSMTKLLRFMGHEVHIASDVPSAIHEAPFFGLDVVLVDFVVPAIEVQGLAEQFRRNPSLAKTPLVAVGRLAGVCQHAESGESAFDGLVTLPAKRAELARLLARVQAEKIWNVDQSRSEQWRERRAKREAYLKSPSPGMKRIIFRFFGGMRDGQELIGKRAEHLFRQLDYQPIYRSFLAGRTRHCRTCITSERHRYFVRTVMETADQVVVLARYYGGVE